MIKSNHIMLAFLIIIAVLLSFNAFGKSDYSNLERAYADSTINSINSSEMIICPVQVDNNLENLFIISKTTSRRKGQSTSPELHLLIYSMEKRGLNFVAARRIEYDTDVSDFGFLPTMPSSLKPKEIKKDIEKWNASYDKNKRTGKKTKKTR